MCDLEDKHWRRPFEADLPILSVIDVVAGYRQRSQEHLVLHRRMTKTERDILDHVLRLHTGEEAAVFHYVLITKEIATPKRT